MKAQILNRVAALAWMLLVTMVVDGAHESATETTVDLMDATDTRNSVVNDWQAVCEHLQRINLSGSGCRPWWNVLKPPSEERLSREQLDLLCPTLCTNSLGLPSCVCISPYKRLRAADRDGICRLFCSVVSLQLDGCSECVNSETTTEFFQSPTTVPSTTSRTTTKTTTTRSTSSTKTTQAPTTSTTPDWEKLCNTLCQIGEGGVLCNCDLPPFF